MRFPPKSLNLCLLAAIPLSLLVAWLTGHWILGAAAALGAMCVLAVRNPQDELVKLYPWLARFLGKTAPEERVDRPSDPPPRAPLPPPRKRISKENCTTPAEQMIAQGRVALLLRPQIAANLSSRELQTAHDSLNEVMAIVPQGPVAMRCRSHDILDAETAARSERLINVEGLLLDRYAVCNRDYLEFLRDGGYEQMSLWDEAIWPAVLGFVDRSGQPGPRFWENGTFPPGKDDYPVVGVSWYEASAYARWAGKRLPTDPEWVKAASWPVLTDASKPVQRRYPWGDSMDRRRANVWGSGYDGTVPVHIMADGASVNGVVQLIGNVWEWTNSTFGAWEPNGHKLETPHPLKSIRGGAYDTYFDTQAHCHFQSGAGPLDRKHNIGFRCALGFCDVVVGDIAGHGGEADEPHSEEASHDTEEVLA
jgi:formylglycine-generating enzyme required for sulfatase activity